MSQPIPVFVELCAGLASVSGVLQHGSTWKPPISRMGRKTGYAGAILRVMGLRPRQGARGYVWAEADSDVAALLAAYTQPEVMREIASIIRSWIPCPYGPHAPDPSCSRCKGTGRWDARDLWEVLRREERRGLWAGGGDPGEVAGWAWSVRREMGSGVPGFRSSNGEGRSGEHFAPAAPAPHFDRAALPWPPVLIAQDAAVDVGSVAGWIQQGGTSYRRGTPESGFDDALARVGVNKWNAGDPRDVGVFPAVIWPPVHLTPAADLPVPPIPSGTVVYMDPPYLNTTGYKHDLPRAAVVEIAQHWLDAGARVYISEAEPIAIPGWHHVEITSERKGQARTFGATPEWLTCSHPPAWTPAVQHGLFGRAA